MRNPTSRRRLLNTAFLIGLASGAHGQTTWTGDVSQDWATADNWTAGVPGADTPAFINVATGNFPQITSAQTKTGTVGGNDLWIGQGAGQEGRLDINNAGSLDTSGTWLVVGDDSGTGTLNVNSGGSITSNAELRSGEDGGHGIVNINGGSVTVTALTNEATSELHISNGGSLTATNGNIQMRAGAVASSLDGGSMSASGQIFIGNGGAGTSFNLDAGSMQSGQWFVVGLGGGVTGTLNMTDGTINSSTTEGFTTIGAGGGTGVVNQSGGTWTETNKTVLGENTGGTGTFNLNGGVLQTGAVETGAGTGNLSLNGGTLRAGRDESNFINTTTSVAVGNSGAAVDSNGFDVSINANLVATGTGGLDKQGAGSVDLVGTANLVDAASVSAGTLIISGALGTVNGISVDSGAAIGAGDADGGTITGDLFLASGATIDLTNGLLTVAAGGTVSFGGFGFDDLLGFDVNTAENGVYTLIDGEFTLDSTNIANFGEGNALNLGDGRSAYFDEGSLTAVVIPEPTVALLGSLGLLGLLRRRRG